MPNEKKSKQPSNKNFYFYDYKIAHDFFFQIIDAECERLKNDEYEEILFVWTNDFFNSDGMQS